MNFKERIIKEFGKLDIEPSMLGENRAWDIYRDHVEEINKLLENATTYYKYDGCEFSLWQRQIWYALSQIRG